MMESSAFFRLVKLLIKPTKKMGTNLAKNEKFNSSEAKILTESEISLLLTNTTMTRDQIIDFHANFLKDCPSGILTKKEFCLFFKQLHNNNSKSQKVEKFSEYVFNAFDSDSNEIISFTDFVVCFSITSFGNLRQKIELAFKIYDLDKNNVIDKHEMLKVLEALFDLTGISENDRKEKKSPKILVESMIKSLDKNGDNVLQIEEFVDGCLKDDTICSILIDPMFNC